MSSMACSNKVITIGAGIASATSFRRIGFKWFMNCSLPFFEMELMPFQVKLLYR
jgi:hypothetical protein